MNNRKNNPVREPLTKEGIDYEFYCGEYSLFDKSDQDYLLRKIIYDEYLEKYNECQDVSKKDDMLIEAILKVYPDALDEYPLLRNLPQKAKEVDIEENNTEKNTNIKVMNWIKNGRKAMGVGLERVKQITAKYLGRSEQERKNEHDDVEK